MFERTPRRQRTELARVLKVLAIIGLSVVGLWALFSSLMRCPCGFDDEVSDEQNAQRQVDMLARRMDRETCLDPPDTQPEDLRDPWNTQVRVFCYGGFVRVISTGPDRTLWTDDDIRSRGDGYKDP
jgi:hypothetical protein